MPRRIGQQLTRCAGRRCRMATMLPWPSPTARFDHENRADALRPLGKLAPASTGRPAGRMLSRVGLKAYASIRRCTVTMTVPSLVEA